MVKANLRILGLCGAILLSIGTAFSSAFVVRDLPAGGIYFSDKIVIVNKYDTPPYQTGRVSAGIAVSGVSSVDELCRQYGVIRIEPFYSGKLRKPTLEREISRIYIFTLPEGQDARDLLDYFTADSHIELAELYAVPEPCYIPNDPDIDMQWYLDKVDAYEAWDVVRGDTTRHSVIGIVDTGVYWMHPDLAANIWINVPEDLNGNGHMDAGDINVIDDDGNGYVDDVIGWDMGQNDNNPAENTPYHGTPVAGSASEVTDNNLGGAGIGFSARIMPVKGSNAQNQLTAVYEGMIYAADNGADIVNCSWGSPVYSQTSQNIINSLVGLNVLVVAAAGSGGTTPYYPAAYEGVIAVGSTDQDDHITPFSGYGTWVDVCAPGVSIRSTWGQSSYTYLDGTSFSAPMVCGLAALIRAWLPGLTVGQIETLIISSADNIDSLNPGYPDSLVPPRINCYNWIPVTSAEDQELPNEFLLAQNYPNPFNAATVIRFILPTASEVRLEIYDIMGRKIETLVDSPQNAGPRAVSWSPGGVPSGIYFYRISADGRSFSRPMVHLK
ncbi:MAG: hypothetical protein A2W25_06380 [candidate division Zixibacteria bacterium RBG_16_53_22]|nr:MAG: hypothetical protein A2W25_06380 [candidate division Zixibacteria bacterium RBG_16_53_22]